MEPIHCRNMTRGCITLTLVCVRKAPQTMFLSFYRLAGASQKTPRTVELPGLVLITWLCEYMCPRLLLFSCHRIFIYKFSVQTGQFLVP